LTDSINKKHAINLSKTFVKATMKELGLKYKAVTYVNPQANCERCLVLRQQYAVVMLGLLQKGKRIINIDETWIDTTSYTRRHWQPAAGLPSFREKSVSPRISMIAAICSTGSTFLSIIQANSNNEVMAVFFTYLVRKLDSQDPNWRDNSVVLLDNASYHTNPELKQYLTWVNVPLCFSGPYSYTTAPAELFFAHFKKGQLNMDGLGTGKK
jgi:hypothetical protein